MTLMPVEASPVLRLVSKAAAVDPDGTHELLRLALYETLAEQVDAARSDLSRDLDTFIAKRSDETRRALVRKYIDARMAGEDVDDLLEVAAKITLEDFGKSEAVVTKPDDKKTPWWDARDILGRFTSAANRGAAMATAAEGADKLRDDPFDKPKYANMRATGAALTALGGPSASHIGAAATALGAFGPEAEKVLGQGLRRTAYRYRGTEKRPDSSLKRDVKTAGYRWIERDPEKLAAYHRGLSAYKDESSSARQLAGRAPGGDTSDRKRREGVSPGVEIGEFWARRGARYNDEQKELNALGDTAVAYYLDKIPGVEETRISIAAGAVPPSQGVIIDADGDIVSEAMGYNGDHYVPFDLKNLRSLQGGQYVRTRAVGGPTTEDIYTGLLAGARQVQVVSNSGVFTLEFDPSLRGGKRYSDKARQMVKRYERILDAIQQGGKPADKGGSELYQVDLKPAEVRAIRQKAAQDYSDPDTADRVANQEIAAARRTKQFNMLSDEEIEDQVNEQFPEYHKKVGGSPKQAKVDLRNELKEQARENAVKAYALDGDGYEAALNALKTEFPYFVRDVRRERLPDFVNTRGLQADVRYSSATDRGYVSPRNKASGLADSVTETREGRQVQRRPFKGAQPGQAAAGAAPVTEGEEKPQAGAGAPSAGVGRKFSYRDVLQEPEAKQALQRAAVSLKEASEWVVDPLEVDSIVPDRNHPELWAGATSGQKLRWVMLNASNHKGGMADYLINKASPEEVQALKDSLVGLDDALADFPKLKPADREAMVEAGNQALTLLNFIDPFEKADDPLAYDPTVTLKPMAYQEIIDAGLDSKQIGSLVERFISQTPEHRTLYEQVQKDPNEAPADIQYEQSQAARARRDGKQDEMARHAANVERLQQAWALVRARDLAEEAEALLGGPPQGKAPASPEEAPSAQGVRKRQVSVHPRGSQLATEFQRFLASRS